MATHKMLHTVITVHYLLYILYPMVNALSELDICLPPGSACIYNRDCCGGREPTNTEMTASVHCLTTCCVKTHHFGCQQHSDCCTEGTVCDLQIGGQCTLKLITTDSLEESFPNLHEEDDDLNLLTTDLPEDGGMVSEAKLFDEDDFPMNKEGDKTKLMVVIAVSIMMCNVCCFSFHRRNKQIFFISKAQIDRIRKRMDSEHYDSEHFEYLNEPNRISFVFDAKERRRGDDDESLRLQPIDQDIPLPPEPGRF